MMSWANSKTTDWKKEILGFRVGRVDPVVRRADRLGRAGRVVEADSCPVGLAVLGFETGTGLGRIGLTVVLGIGFGPGPAGRRFVVPLADLGLGCRIVRLTAALDLVADLAPDRR